MMRHARKGEPPGWRKWRLSLALIPIGLMFACSEQKPDEVSQAIKEETSPVGEDRDQIVGDDEQWRHYTNARFDFAVEVPPGFLPLAGPQNGDGRIFVKDGSRLRVSGRYNLDSEFDDQINDASKGLTLLSHDKPSPVTWRATAQLATGERVGLMLARGAERIVTARFTYPDDDPTAEKQASRTLDSLRFLAHAGPLTYRYQPTRFASKPVVFSLPGERAWPVDGAKLIPWERASQLGKPICRYGLSGQKQICSAKKEAGLTFAVIDRPLARLRKQFPEALAEPSKLAGREALKITEQAEGSGISYSLIPAGSRTVAVVRSWRQDSEKTGYQEILQDLSFETEPDVGSSRDGSAGPTR
ncbi:MAG: hypothetical protein QUV08_11795 [Parasphingorhabdus sp.]|nr:hypothetical protein [Parasphingorhabdus sp.]